MQNIKIVTDSASDLSLREAKELNVEILPILISYNQTTIKELFDISTENYWKLLLELEEVPQTAQIQLGSFLKCFKDAKEAGFTDLLYISINSKGSGTFGAATIARDMFYAEYGKDLNIELVDSLTYSYLYGSVVCECAIKAKNNEPFSDIVSFAKTRLKTIKAYLLSLDLKHLKKSGRISGTAAFIGEALGLKPLMDVSNGDVVVCDKIRGENLAIKKMISLVKEEAKNASDEVCYIVHGIYDKDALLDLKNKLIEEVGFKDVIFKKLGASITTNAGPKSLAIGYHK